MRVKITVGKNLMFAAEFQEKQAPGTVAAFKKLLPYKQRIVHCRWSGEGCWIPLGDFKLDVGFENHTSYPAPGQILWYPGGFSETELGIDKNLTRSVKLNGKLHNHQMI